MVDRKIQRSNNSSKGRTRKGSLLTTVRNTSQVSKNKNGGVNVNQHDICACLDFFKSNENSQSNVLTIDSIKNKLEALLGDNASQFLSNRELRQLMNGKKSLSRSDIETLLLNNSVSKFYRAIVQFLFLLMIQFRFPKVKNFDPVQKIFEQCFDPAKKGFITSATLRQIFKSLGYGNLSKEEEEVILRAADVDLDGRISLQDFRSMVESGKINEC